MTTLCFSLVFQNERTSSSGCWKTKEFFLKIRIAERSIGSNYFTTLKELPGFIKELVVFWVIN
jgi:hypothetical protein